MTSTELPRRTTATRCHCGALFGTRDHCPYCGCEQYERYCDATAVPMPHVPRLFGTVSDALDYADRLADTIDCPAVVETDHLVAGAVMPPAECRSYIAVGTGDRPDRYRIGTGATHRPTRPPTHDGLLAQLLLEMNR